MSVYRANIIILGTPLEGCSLNEPKCHFSRNLKARQAKQASKECMPQQTRQLISLCHQSQYRLPNLQKKGHQVTKLNEEAYRNQPKQLNNASKQIGYGVDLDELIPSNPYSNRMVHRQPTDKVKRVGSTSKSDYVPSFTQSNNPSNNTTLTAGSKPSLPNKALEHGSNQSRYQKTRNSILSHKTLDETKPKGRQIDSYGFSQNGRFEKPSLLGLSSNISEDVLKHFEFLNGIEKKLKVKE